MSQDSRIKQAHADDRELQVQEGAGAAISEVHVPPQARRLTIDDLREELKPILRRSEAANLC
jgi:hypothetical protein